MTYCKIENGVLGRLYSYFFFALFSHWLIQSFFYMDKYEKSLKVAIELLIFFHLLILFQNSWSVRSIALIIFTTHTINFILNNHFWGLAKHYGLCEREPDLLDRYAQTLSQRLIRNNCILSAYIYGSNVRGELKKGSDLDIRVIRKKGLMVAILSSLLIARERFFAFIMRIPLDIYVFSVMPKMAEKPIALFNKDCNKVEGL